MSGEHIGLMMKGIIVSTMILIQNIMEKAMQWKLLKHIRIAF